MRLWYLIISLLHLVDLTGCVQIQKQYWDDAVDAVKKDITEFADRIKGSAIFDGISKAINLTLSAADTLEEAIPQTKICVMHIVTRLTLKRLQKIISSYDQLSGHSYEVIYWIPREARSELETRDIDILYDILPAKAVRILDLSVFNGRDRDFMSSEECANDLCNDLIIAKVYQLRLTERLEAPTVHIHENSTFWLLDVDMSWIGNLASMLQKLSLPAYRFPFSSLLIGDEELTDTSVDLLCACTDETGWNTTVKSPLDVYYDKVKGDFDKWSEDISQALKDTVDVITVQIYGNDTFIPQQKKVKPFISNPAFCISEIAKFSGNFLQVLYQVTFDTAGPIVLKTRENDYWQLALEHNLKYDNFLEFGLKEGILGKDFFPRIKLVEEAIIDDAGDDESKGEDDQKGRANHAGDSRDIVTENEFEILKAQFIEEQSEPLVFERKVGTFFRNVVL